MSHLYEGHGNLKEHVAVYDMTLVYLDDVDQCSAHETLQAHFHTGGTCQMLCMNVTSDVYSHARSHDAGRAQVPVSEGELARTSIIERAAARCVHCIVLQA